MSFEAPRAQSSHSCRRALQSGQKILQHMPLLASMHTTTAAVLLPYTARFNNPRKLLQQCAMWWLIRVFLCHIRSKSFCTRVKHISNPFNFMHFCKGDLRLISAQHNVSPAKHIHSKWDCRRNSIQNVFNQFINQKKYSNLLRISESIQL